MSVDWSIETHDSVKSTQDIIKGMGRLHEPEGKVVQAFEQTKGQGRHGRPWISEKGNVYLSILLRPDCHASRVTQFSLVTALALSETIQNYMIEPERLKLKWPNDIQIDGEKCAGILLETELNENGGVKWLAIGTGVNISNPPIGMGVGVQDYSEQIIDLISFRNAYLKNMAILYNRWNRDEFDAIRKAWIEKAHAKDTPMEVKIGVQIERGFYHGLDEAGNLLLRDNEFRIKTVSAGEIHFLDKDKFG